MSKTVRLYNLPKISLNVWYAGQFWVNRKIIKDNYRLIVKNQYKHVFSKTNQYVVKYAFYFKSRPLDASNCVAMVKLIEDIIFENDKYDIIKKISIKSRKNKTEFVEITINTL